MNEPVVPTETLKSAVQAAGLLKAIHRWDGEAILCAKLPRWQQTAIPTSAITAEALVPFVSVRDCYFTINTMAHARRESTCAVYLNAVWVDLDGPDKETVLNFDDVRRAIWERELAGELPRFSFLVDSGRGVWGILLLQGEDGGPEIATEETRRYQQEVNRVLASRLADLGADTGVHDAARVTRLPGSINGRTGRPVIYHPQLEPVSYFAASHARLPPCPIDGGRFAGT